MATTTPSNVDTSIPEVWAKLVLRLHTYDSFWDRFVSGEGGGGCLIRRTDLLNSPGDTIHIQTTDPLSGAGVSGDVSVLEGNEENLTSAEFTVVPEVYRHAVKVNRRAQKKSILDLREEASMRLAEWGREKMDNVRFANFLQTTNLNGAAYTPNIKYANDATLTSNIDSSDKLTVNDIRKIRYLLQTQKARPFKVNGLDVYFGVIHPGQALDLKNDSTYNTAIQNALPRLEASNPMFTGALAMIDGIVLFESFKLPTVSNWGSGGTLPGATALFFGQEAFVEGIDESVSWNEDTFDYGWHFGTAYHFAFQPRRARPHNSLFYRSYITPVS